MSAQMLPPPTDWPRCADCGAASCHSLTRADSLCFTCGLVADAPRVTGEEPALPWERDFDVLLPPALVVS